MDRIGDGEGVYGLFYTAGSVKIVRYNYAQEEVIGGPCRNFV